MAQVWVVTESLYGNGAPAVHCFNTLIGAVDAMRAIVRENSDTMDEEIVDLTEEVDSVIRNGAGSVSVNDDFTVALQSVNVEP